MPSCQCKNQINNSKDNIPLLEPGNHTAAGPGKWTIVEAQDKNLKIAFMSKSKVIKEEMNKSIKEIYENIME